MSNKELRDGEPCSHKGCLNHISHPCEGCGRVSGINNHLLTRDELEGFAECIHRDCSDDIFCTDCKASKKCSNDSFKMLVETALALMDENEKLKHERDSQQRIAISVMDENEKLAMLGGSIFKAGSDSFAENKKLKEMLRRLEFMIIRYPAWLQCPVCRNFKEYGHKDDCELGKLLQEAGE